MEKRHELASVHSCISRAEPEEPIFVLRAKDPVAAQAVRLWANMAVGIHEPEKAQEAYALADSMDRWREERAPVEVMPEPPQVSRTGRGRGR